VEEPPRGGVPGSSGTGGSTSQSGAARSGRCSRWREPSASLSTACADGAAESGTSSCRVPEPPDAATLAPLASGWFRGADGNGIRTTPRLLDARIRGEQTAPTPHRPAWSGEVCLGATGERLAAGCGPGAGRSSRSCMVSECRLSDWKIPPSTFGLGAAPGVCSGLRTASLAPAPPPLPRLDSASSRLRTVKPEAGLPLGEGSMRQVARCPRSSGDRWGLLPGSLCPSGDAAAETRSHSPVSESPVVGAGLALCLLCFGPACLATTVDRPDWRALWAA